MTNKTKFIIELYEMGYSCRNLAEMFGMKKNSVIALLRSTGNIRQALGIDIEKQVADRLKAKQMPGDCYFDLEWKGKKLDVKSSRPTKDGAYKYALNTKSGKRKSNHLIDAYVLVKTDSREMYLLTSSQVATYQTSLTIGRTRTKYNLEPIGTL